MLHISLPTQQIPIVIGVLLGFTVALPATLSFYIIYHRNHLYSTSVHEKIGWLYDPFVRGAEWWQIHDVLLKMVLTGLLIYIPPASRAGIAALICMFAIANLNYFHPHKNKVLFWLTQLSFMTTGAKYVMALLLSAGTAKQNEGAYCRNFLTQDECITSSEQTCQWDGNSVCTSPLIGNILISLDVVFMASSFLAVPIAICVLKFKFDRLEKNGPALALNEMQDGHRSRSGGSSTSSMSNQVVPVLNRINNLEHVRVETSSTTDSFRRQQEQEVEMVHMVQIPPPNPEIQEIKKIMVKLVKNPQEMHSLFKKLDREHSHGLTKDEFHLFVKSACQKVGTELNERVFKLLWLSIEHHKVEDHDELEEAAIEKWLFAVPEVGLSGNKQEQHVPSELTAEGLNSWDRDQGQMGHHHHSRGRHGGVIDKIAESAAKGNHMDL